MSHDETKCGFNCRDDGGDRPGDDPTYGPTASGRRQEVIEQLCKMMTRAWNTVDPSGSEASDCVCRSNAFNAGDKYRNAGHALTFMEEAVSAHIAKYERKQRPSEAPACEGCGAPIARLNWEGVDTTPRRCDRCRREEEASGGPGGPSAEPQGRDRSTHATGDSDVEPAGGPEEAGTFLRPSEATPEQQYEAANRRLTGGRGRPWESLQDFEREEWRRRTAMKLANLNPRWARTMYDASGVQIGELERRVGMGITFDCPCCRRVRLSVFFANPVDGRAPADGQKLWQRVSGETFEDLTISPSIDASAKGHWHGFITNGEIR